MRTIRNMQFDFGQPGTGLLVLGISGVGSIPDPWCQRPRRPPPVSVIGRSAKLGFRSTESPMNGTRLAWDVAFLLLAGTGLSTGLTRLATAPLSAVLIILGAMGLLMFPAASLCGAAVQPTGLWEKWKSNHTPRRLSRLHDHDKEK